jgi:prophage tail gpP-like protein
MAPNAPTVGYTLPAGSGVAPTTPNPYEIATIVTPAGEWTAWESVWVQHRWADSSALFRFTTAEFSPMPTRWTSLKLLPGDFVDILLGGQLAIQDGIIVERQVGYDAMNHSVQLSGRSLTWIAATSSVDPPRSFDNMGIVDVAHALFDPYGVGVVTIGSPDNSPFKNLQSQPGEFNWDFLETHARPKGVVLGSDHLSNFLIIGDHVNPVIATLQEGVNIKRMNCLINIENTYAIYGATAIGSAGSDDQWGSDISDLRQYAPGQGPAGRNILVPAPSSIQTLMDVQKMAHNEAKWSDGTKIQASVVVQGWMRPGTAELWRAGDNVSVWSPMAVLNNQTLKIQTVTFTQDRNSGTETTLDLVVPWLLNDKIQGVFPVMTDPADIINNAGGFRGTLQATQTAQQQQLDEQQP